MTDIVERLREQPKMSIFANIGDMVGRLNHEREEAADEIERLREFVSGLACDCEGEQCKVYGEDYLRFDCGYRKARTALGEKE